MSLESGTSSVVFLTVNFRFVKMSDFAKKVRFCEIFAYFATKVRFSRFWESTDCITREKWHFWAIFSKYYDFIYFLKIFFNKLKNNEYQKLVSIPLQKSKQFRDFSQIVFFGTKNQKFCQNDLQKWSNKEPPPERNTVAKRLLEGVHMTDICHVNLVPTGIG